MFSAFVDHSLTPEFLAARRQTFLDVLALHARGEHVPKRIIPKIVPPPRVRKRAPRVATPRPRLSPEELKRRKAERSRGRKRRYSASKAKFTLEPGSWIRAGGGRIVDFVAQVLAQVPSGTAPEHPGYGTRAANTKWGPSRFNRYLLAVYDNPDALGRPRIRLAIAAELESCIQEVMAERPAILPGRYAEPLAAGTYVAWQSHGNNSFAAREGVIEGYIPAGESLNVSPHAHIRRAADGLADQSLRDRYIIRCKRSTKRNGAIRYRWVAPSAYTIEKPLLNAPTPNERTA